MTAFYMFRLVYMTFEGGYRGPEWEHAGHGAAHGDHGSHDAHDDHGGPSTGSGHGGHGPWHGPHESPTPMTFPLMALAVGAIVAGLVGIPAALGTSGSAIEHFLEPSFTAEGSHEAGAPVEAPREPAHEASRVEELTLMAGSVLIAVAGILLARKFYVTSPEISEQLAERYAGAHRTLSNKYYVDELYDATVISGTYASARGLWTFDRNVVDGMVNGTSWVTVITSFFSGLWDKSIVDGLVNLIGRIVEEGSFWFRKLQTGLVQNYALWMLAGIFAFVSIYLFVR
jgi:NADH:ubiquinone oxidoreductase subunit 5 (subunit L)/multisubunit Na+/H+ antiporter MnhA subunit